MMLESDHAPDDAGTSTARPAMSDTTINGTAEETETGGAGLRRAVSLPMLVLYGLGTTVGAGIYALTGALEGFMEARLNIALRLGLAVVGVALLWPSNLMVQGAALAGFALLFGLHLVLARKKNGN